MLCFKQHNINEVKFIEGRNQATNLGLLQHVTTNITLECTIVVLLNIQNSDNVCTMAIKPKKIMF